VGRSIVVDIYVKFYENPSIQLLLGSTHCTDVFPVQCKPSGLLFFVSLCEIFERR
jgi:hypothetical protein